jgi:hypothetical protein
MTIEDINFSISFYDKGSTKESVFTDDDGNPTGRAIIELVIVSKD